MARKLLMCEANPECGTNDGVATGTRPLHLAVARGDAKMVGLFLRWGGASAKTKDEYRATAIDYTLELLEDGMAGPLGGGGGCGRGSPARLVVGLLGAVPGEINDQLPRWSRAIIKIDIRAVNSRRDSIMSYEELLPGGM